MRRLRSETSARSGRSVQQRGKYEIPFRNKHFRRFVYILFFYYYYYCSIKRRAISPKKALESVVLTMARSGVFPLNAYTETLFFMVANACLMYAVRVSESNAHSNYTWYVKRQTIMFGPLNVYNGPPPSACDRQRVVSADGYLFIYITICRFFKPDADAAPDLDGKSFAEKLFKVNSLIRSATRTRRRFLFFDGACNFFFSSENEKIFRNRRSVRDFAHSRRGRDRRVAEKRSQTFHRQHAQTRRLRRFVRRRVRGRIPCFVIVAPNRT